ncbi:pseudaminic acid synthase [Candidatus Magnetomorum sp. HK-1]|nr:pseudaminic acid synthase [Candidatus Magnetomorum sp. HK-1]
MQINNRKIGAGHPTYIIAELSANHHQSYEKAVNLVCAAKESGADAVKIQTYTPDTMTLNCNNDLFKIKGGTIWDGHNLHSLYKKAFTPWEWQPKLKEKAEEIGIELFSTAYDITSVDFLEKIGVSAYKVASFELIDIPLLEKIGSTGKPVIVSTGMGTLAEIDEAVTTLRYSGCPDIALLKCTSSYPASVQEMNLRTIPHMAAIFDVISGLSDHTISTIVPVIAVTLGACIIEKHITISRKDIGPDSKFSLEIEEFKEMVAAIRDCEKAIGDIFFGCTSNEKNSLTFRRSIFISENVKRGEMLTEKNIKIIRPGHGLHPKYFNKIIGSTARVDLDKGTPLTWSCINKNY